MEGAVAAFNACTPLLNNITAADYCPIDIGQLPDGEPFTLEQLRAGAVVIHIAVMIYMFLALAIVCDDYFVPALEEMVEWLQISPDVAGATLMAAGGSMPELFTSLIGTFTGSDVGFGTVVGSAVFNVLFVIGCCALFSKETLTLTWWPLFRDCVCYCISLLTLATFFGIASCQQIHWYESLTLLCMYAGYCVVMKFNDQMHGLVQGCARAICGCCGGSARAPAGALTRNVDVVNVQMDTMSTEGGGGGGGGAAAAAAAWTSAAASAASPAPNGDRSPMDRHWSFAWMKPHHQKPSGRRTGGGPLSGDLEGPSDSPSFTRERVESTFKRSMNVRISVLSALVDESPLMSSAAFLELRMKRGGIQDVFDQIDKDGSGSIDQGEIRELLEYLWGRPVAEAELTQAMGAVDLNSDGKVGFDEFVTWYLSSDQRLQEELKKKFASLDLDHDGQLTPAELKPLLLTEGGMQVASDSEIEQAMQEIENLTRTTNRGTINLAEFAVWYKASLFWAQQKSSAEKAALTMAEGAPPLWELPKTHAARARYMFVFPLFFVLHYTIPDVRNKRWRRFFALSFLISICWIGAFSYVMVFAATSIGVVLGIPTVVMGLTFLAAGTSVPDLLTSVIVARQGQGDMAVSSSIGSNIFDVLVGLPLPWLIFALAKGTYVSVGADSLFTSVLVLMIMLSAVVTTVALCGWRMTRGLGAVMFLLYGLFVLQDLLFQFCFVTLPDSMKPCKALAIC